MRSACLAAATVATSWKPLSTSKRLPSAPERCRFQLSSMQCVRCATTSSDSSPQSYFAEEMHNDADSPWMLREHVVPTQVGEAKLTIWEGKHVFLDGTGVRTWPAAKFLLSYLLRPQDFGCQSRKFSKLRVLELGSGCGLVALSLGRLGAKITAVDDSPVALALASENRAKVEKDEGISLDVCFRRLDWKDLEACERLVEESGPFDLIISADCVLSSTPPGPMWRQSESTSAAMISPPEPLLESTRVLSRAGSTEIVLLVTDRTGDVAATARALLQRRWALEVLELPKERVLEGGSCRTTIFHFRWTSQ
eukprot:TRINITY_DN50980_c0_g1_i1.p1 TRINITY_DN50980_c0_g1~~TRINITY_DN50980_c0_g1_i1.p1  ORF type:complete len:309 (+),score=58.56 TRINITY_DN50980_c0_g1_i1:80-1006(+)